MRTQLVERMDGSFAIMDVDDDAPMAKISFYNEARGQGAEVKKQFVADHFVPQGFAWSWLWFLLCCGTGALAIAAHRQGGLPILLHHEVVKVTIALFFFFSLGMLIGWSSTRARCQRKH